MTAYYNEHDPFAAAWLRELIKANHIPDGIVDERSIEDVIPAELAEFTQCHFFAGIGGWPLALRLAGWPDDRPVWTGSCPCQPFSAAGKGAGFADERHLWPAFEWLIGQRKPGVVFGEQVASKHGLAWLDLVQTDMEAQGYAFGAVDLCAAGVGSPHIRQRLFWVADGESKRRDGGESPSGARGRFGVEVSRHAGRLADTTGDGRNQQEHPGAMVRSASEKSEHEQIGISYSAVRGGTNAEGQSAAGPTNGLWRDADWLLCRDGKWRPAQPGTFPLVARVSPGVVPGSDPCVPIDENSSSEARVMRLRGYGNSIVPQAAAEVIRAVMI
jgi:DNA (cytosine-5)-methyltransferase 1